MGERITDEQFAKVEEYAKQGFPEFEYSDRMLYWNEVWDALKAERKWAVKMEGYFDDRAKRVTNRNTRITELKAHNAAGICHVAELEEHIKKLEAQLKAVEANLKKCVESCGEWADLNEALEAQIKVTTDLYFEGCDSDTFDDRMLELRQAQILEQGGE